MNNKIIVWPRVISDMVNRNEEGYKKYNKYLTTNSGDNILQHAYEEALDLAVYIKTKLLELEEEQQNQLLIKAKQHQENLAKYHTYCVEKEACNPYVYEA
jgi:hypothetical protein